MKILQDCDYCGDPEVLVKVEGADFNVAAVCRACYEKCVCSSCDCWCGEDGCHTCEGEPICSCCNGSGQGMYDGSKCSSCGGTGADDSRQRKQDEADLRADYMYDRWKEER